MLDFLRRNSEKIIWGVLIAFVLSIGILSFSKPNKGRATNKGGSYYKAQGQLATVNNKEINSRYFTRMYNAGLSNYRPAEQRDPVDPKIDAYLRYNALRQTVDFEKYLNFAKELRVRADGSELKFQIDGILKNYNLKSKKELKELLAKNGYNYKEFESDIRNELIVNKMFALVRQKAVVTDKDMQNQFKQVNARHILIMVPPNEDKEQHEKMKAAARERIAAIYDRIAKGEDFAKLAKENSDDKGSAENGGELGWFGVGRMVPEFEDVAFALEKGRYSKPFETSYGFHIVKVEDVKQKDIPLDVDEKELKKKMLEEKQQAEMRKLQQKIEAETETEIFLPLAKAYDYRMKGNADKALAEYRLLSSQNPQSPVPYLFTAEFYENQNQNAEALAEYKKALLLEKLNPAAKSPFTHFYLGSYYVKAKNKKAAADELKKAEDLIKDDIRLLERIKESYDKIGSKTAAARVGVRIKSIENAWKAAAKAGEDVNFTEKTATANKK